MSDALAEIALINEVLLLAAKQLTTDSSHAEIDEQLVGIASSAIDPVNEHRILTEIKRRTRLPIAELRALLAQHKGKYSTAPDHPPWFEHLQCKRDGTPHPNAENVLMALRRAAEWQGVFGMSDFDQRAWLRLAPPWHDNQSGQFLSRPMRDSDEARVLVWMQEHGLHVETRAVSSALAVVLDEHRWHPVREWMRGLEWDGKVRCNDWLHRSLGVVPIADYTDRIAVAWLISGVARIMEPGCIAKYVLVLEGPQDLGKSKALSILGGQWFSDDIEALGSKDSKIQVGNALVIELPELDSIRRSDISAVKAFISRRVDRYRPPYGRHIVDQPRQSILAATTNDQKWLGDDTGGVRFWPVRCAGHIDLDWLSENRDQLWAEAVVRYDVGEHWWHDDAPAVKAAREEQDARIDEDVWEEKIRKWLDGTASSETTTYEVMINCLEMTEARDQTRAAQQRIARILLHRLGWKARRNATRRWYER